MSRLKNRGEIIESRARRPRAILTINPKIDRQILDFAPQNMKDVLVEKGEFLRRILLANSTGLTTVAKKLGLPSKK
jgi:hypothetical protein